MKKSMFASAKPLAMAIAVAGGASVSMIAVALPGGDTSGAAGVVNESVCHNTVDMTIASGSRSVTTGTGDCQLRTLAPTKGFVLANSTPAGSTVTDSSALLGAGGELYETYVAGKRSGALLLTPNRSLAVTRSSSFVTGVDGASSFDIGAAVQPATGLQDAWLTGTYNVISRTHAFGKVASDMENSVYAAPNYALGERNFTVAMEVTFNGDGTCNINAMDNRQSFQLTKDPLMNSFGEMDVTCFTGGGQCGQNDGNDYIARGNVNVGPTGNPTDYFDWGDVSGDGKGGRANPAGDCSYTTSAGVATVTYNTQSYYTYLDEFDQPVTDVTGTATWTQAYNVSADLRYLVSSAPGTQASLGGSGNADGTSIADKGDIAVGVRVGAGDVTGKTYLYNSTEALYAASTPSTSSYENPANPADQEEECISRGSITFTSADAGGGYKTCNIQGVSSCSDRSIGGGKEETTVGGADGTITDSLSAFDAVDGATPCRWSDTSGLTVLIDETDPDSAPVVVTLKGDVSDNGEALVLHGGYNVGGAAPDEENAPLLPQQKYNVVQFVVGQEYQGSLTADADADTTTNYGEFVWAADVTPASGSVKRDFNSDGGSDLLFARPSDGQLQTWIVDEATGTTTSGKNWVTAIAAPWAVVATGDVDGNGQADVMYQNSTTGQLMVVKMGADGMSYNTKYWLGNALAPSTFWVFNGMGDFNGDGSDDILWRRSTDGQVQVWLSSTDGLTIASKVWVAPRATNWVIKGVGDMNGDGRSDIVWRDGTSGQMAVWIMAAGGVTIQTNAWLPEAVTDASGWVYKGLSDTDGDGGTDILYGRTSDGMVMVWQMAADGVARTSKDWISAIATTWTIKDTGTDYNADGRGDILFSNTTGQHQVWLIGADGKSKQTAAWLSGAITGWDYN